MAEIKIKVTKITGEGTKLESVCVCVYLLFVAAVIGLFQRSL